MNLSKPIHQILNSSFNVWLLEIAPLIVVIVSLWCKQLYFYYSLRHVWWYKNESFDRLFIAHPDMLSMNLAILLLLASLVIFLPRISRFIVLIILDLLLTSLILADKLYVLMFADILSASEIVNAHMLLEVRESILDLLKPSYIGYYLDVIVGIVLLPFYINKCKRIPYLDPKYIKYLFVGSLASSIIIAAPTFRLAWKDQYDLFASTTLQRDVCGTIGLLPYHIVDIASQMVGRNEKIEKRNLKRVEDYLENERKERNNESKLFGIAKGKNVILIMVESLNSFPIGLKVNGQLVTPRLSEFAKDSLYFVNIYDQTHLGKTSDAEFMSLQSLYPVAVGTVAGNFHSRSYFGLPAILSQYGYTTLSATGGAAQFWNMIKIHKRIGFQQSFFQDSYNIRERIGRWLSDKQFFIQTIPILQEQKEPFIAYLLTSSTHHPYKVPEKYKALNIGELEETTIGNYLHAVHYFDKEFGEFIDKLKETGLLDRSIVVVYGDHAAPRIELNYISEPLGYPTQNNYYTWLLQKRLPLIIRLPFGEAAGVRQITGGQLDIAPTILSLLGVNDESNVMLGRDLTKDESPMVVFRDGSFADGNYIFINLFGPISLSTCYEASTGRVIDCKSLEEKRLKALERLEISDLIIHGDFIPALIADMLLQNDNVTI
ncbi:MAG: LTA synthase family protein [Candidatus Dadabacteria bacterium]|nr:LTA synthase family protein [Candidatus Dadabacteria bacterium]